MTDFNKYQKLLYDLSSHAGLALIGKYLKRFNNNWPVDPAFPVRSGVANGDILKGILGCCVWARTTLMRSRTFVAVIPLCAL